MNLCKCGHACIRSGSLQWIGSILGTLTHANLVVEQVNQQQVSTFLTAGNIKLMLLHGGKNEESIRNFFQDVYELYVKVWCDLLRRTIERRRCHLVGILTLLVA
jgi:hypothetical protein